MINAQWEPRRLMAVKAELPPEVTPAGTAGRILHSALQLFAERGFAGSSIRDIAAGAGINSATLYAHYPSKEKILAHLIVAGHQELHRRLQQALIKAGPGPEAQLTALAKAHVHAHTDYPLLALVANSELHALSPELAAPALQLREQSRQLLLQVLSHGTEAGVFLLPDLLLTATAMSSMGVRVANWFGPDQPYTRDQVADVYAQLTLRLAGCASTQGPAETPGQAETPG